MAGKRTRSRRGNPRGKAYGFHGVRPAQKSAKSAKSESGASQSNSVTASAPSAS